MKRSKGSIGILIGSICVVLAVAVLYPTSPLRRLIHESSLASATSAHYELRFPAGALSPDSVAQLIAQHEKLFAALDTRIGNAGSSAKIRIIFDHAADAESGQSAYTVDGTTIRTIINAQVPTFDPAADAEALLNAAWGKPGNAEIGRWTAHALVGEWNNEELGMAAAGVEHSLGHTNISKLLSPQNGETEQDRTLIGAAWINQVGELGGVSEVRKLYTTKMETPNLTQVSQALGKTPNEVERQWQLWIYAYVAGMPGETGGSMPGMPGMPVGK